MIKRSNNFSVGKVMIRSNAAENVQISFRGDNYRNAISELVKLVGIHGLLVPLVGKDIKPLTTSDHLFISRVHSPHHVNFTANVTNSMAISSHSHLLLFGDDSRVQVDKEAATGHVILVGLHGDHAHAAPDDDNLVLGDLDHHG